MNNKNNSSLKRNFVYTLTYQILTIIIPLVTAPYVSRTIGANGLGIYSFSYSVAYYFVIFIMLGLNNYGSRAIAEHRDNAHELSIIFWEIYSTQLTLGVMLSTVYYVYACFFAQDKISALLLGMYVVSAIFDINWFFYGKEYFKLTVLRNIVIKLLATSCIFIFVRNSSDIYKYCLILSASILLSQLVLWPYLRKEIYFVRPTWINIKKHLKPNAVLFITVLAVSLFKIMDKIMLGVMSSYDQVGFYESAEKVINIPIVFVTALGTVMLPRVTNMLSYDKESDLKLLEASAVFSMWITVPLCMGLMAVSDIFVPFFYGPGFETCIVLYYILLPSCIFLGFANVIRTQFLIPHKMDREYVISALLGAMVNMTINLILIPYFKSAGAAIGTLVAEMAVCIYQCWKVEKRAPVHGAALLSIPAFIAGCGMLFCIKMVNINTTVILQLAVKVIIGGFVYLGTLILLLLLFKDYYIEIINTIRKV